MKPFIISFSFCFLMQVAVGQSNPGEQLSQRIAQRMKDTLGLNEAQRQSIYSLNLQLHNQKQSVRQQFTQLDSITRHVQIIERRRDTLYSPVLSSTQYQLYKQKKRSLISN